LLCLEPSHTPSIRLLSKVLARLDKWDEAETILSKASEHSLEISNDLLHAVQEGKKRHKAKETQQYLHHIQKSKDELKRIKSDFKNISHENNQYALEIIKLHRSVKNWARLCAVVGGGSLALLAYSLSIHTDDPNDINSSMDPSSIEEGLPNTVPIPPTETNSTPEVIEEIIEPEIIEAKPEPEPEPEPKPEPKPEPEPEPEPKAKYPTVHIVRSGDTLSEIAEKYYSRQSLGTWLGQQNNTSAATLQLGQELMIPTPPPVE
jgi:nucleoid-associated protein YgaU